MGSGSVTRPGQRCGVSVIFHGHVLSVRHRVKAVSCQTRSRLCIQLGRGKVLFACIAAFVLIERFVHKVVELIDDGIQINVYTPYLIDKVVNYIIDSIGQCRLRDRESAQRYAAEVDHHIITFQIYSDEFEVVACVLDLYRRGGIRTAVGIHIQINGEFHVKTRQIEDYLTQIDVYARLVEDVAEHACKAYNRLRIFIQSKVEGRAEVEHLIDYALYQHAARVCGALGYILGFGAHLRRPIGSAAQRHVGNAHPAFGFGAFVIHIGIQLTHKVQLHPVLVLIAADCQIYVGVIVAQVCFHTEQVEERFHGCEGHDGNDVVLRDADEHCLIFTEYPIAVFVLFSQIHGGHIAFRTFGAFRAFGAFRVFAGAFVLSRLMVAVNYGIRVVKRL